MMMMSLICSYRNKIGAEFHMYFEEGTYHKRLSRGPSTNATILLFHAVRDRPSEQPLIACTFVIKVYGAYGPDFCFCKDNQKTTVIEEESRARARD
jgi:hypothetical protein